jgi:pyruvate dehydrogenase E1 component alpha subunit
MLRIRIVEETLAAVYPDQEIRCPIHLSTGQEAVAVGACACLRDEDRVLSAHRSHAHYLAKGGELKSLVAELYGRATGCCGGYGGSMHLTDPGAGFIGAVPIVGSTIAIATGVAFAARQKGEGCITLVFFGEGATEEGVFYESVNFAALHRLPILYVCENNLYSVYSPLSVRQPPERNLLTIAQGLGVPADRGDGNDVETVYEQASSAADRVRAGSGPELIEFSTYRWREHCGPNFDNDIGYRTEEEFVEWQSRCPLVRARQRLHELGALTDADEAAACAAFKTEIEGAIAYAKSSPFPTPGREMDRVYAPSHAGGC